MGSGGGGSWSFCLLAGARGKERAAAISCNKFVTSVYVTNIYYPLIGDLEKF